MDTKNYSVIDTCSLGRTVSLVIFQDNTTGEHGVQLLPLPISSLSQETLQEMLVMPKPPGEDAVTLTIALGEDLCQFILPWCAERGITLEQLIVASLRFCVDPRYQRIVIPWLENETGVYQNRCLVERACADTPERIDMAALPSVTREQFQQDPDAVLQRLDAEEGPILIRSGGRPDLLIFSLADWLKRFSPLYTPEEIAEIEEACREYEEQVTD